jgi:hypothetical protein
MRLLDAGWLQTGALAVETEDSEVTREPTERRDHHSDVHPFDRGSVRLAGQEIFDGGRRAIYNVGHISWGLAHFTAASASLSWRGVLIPQFHVNTQFEVSRCRTFLPGSRVVPDTQP